MPDNDRWVLAADAFSVFDRMTGRRWSKHEVMDMIFKKPEPQPEPPMTRDEMMAALSAAADDEPWDELQCSFS